MSKLNSLRGTGNSSAAIFSSNVAAPVASIFARMQGKQTPQQSNSTRKKYTPSRWRVAKGETKSLVIIDEHFTFGMREHSRKKPDGYWETVRCISDFDSCPMCAMPDNRPYDLVLLTVLDLTPWEKDGKTYEFTKRVLALKKNDYEKMQVIAQVNGNNLRGIMLDMVRGHGDKESANGHPSFVRKLTEDEMIEAFGSPEKKYDSGFILPANNAIIAFDYDNIFATPTRDEITAHLGLAPRPGSRAEAEAISEAPPWEEEPETLDLSEELPDVD